MLSGEAPGAVTGSRSRPRERKDLDLRKLDYFIETFNVNGTSA